MLLGSDGILRLTDFGLSREYYMSENKEKRKNKVSNQLSAAPSSNETIDLSPIS